MERFIGHNKVIEGFMKRAESNTLSHAHLIAGRDGIGKSILADIFVSKILNKEVGKEHVDAIHYRNKRASMGVSEVREIIEEVNKRPYEGDKKVIIIYDSEKLTAQAQNALLKTIEEPPNGVYILLLTTNLEIILDTIKSRCQIYKLTPLNKEEMVELIKSKHELSEGQLLSLLAYSEGIPGRAERFLKDPELQTLRNLIIDMLRDINNNEIDVTIKYEKAFQNYKDEKEELLNIISTFIRDIILYKEINDKKLIINSDKSNDIEELIEMMSYRKLNGMLKYIEEARINLKHNTNFSMTISIMLMGFLEV
ncbi:DNA polymerase III subunit delta' [Clostridium sardiniense]|uniref:DNA polymerase III subunit delta' n=1 Tax=Clostridium sardiniense TaxID=29369 RepID=UPI00195B6751|nr:DNA polymerase III subunit delta' [Clostridium sardiniense]MBM7836560.1 DNA polymerase-3 subunit delta' [Clostridium sardiniense]